jgi:2,4-didehydro-3-deoxy-L-rhamnonate hydrolase
MRFVTFSDPRGRRAGVLTGDIGDDDTRVLDLAHARFADVLRGTPADMLSMVRSGLGDIASRIATAGVSDDARLTLGSVRIHAPLLNPPTIIGVAHNYQCALEERGIDAPETPVVFEKKPFTVIGPDEAIVLPPDIGGVTYEAELAVIIGKEGRDIPASQALDHVAGYAALNDISASELIKADGNFERGKNFPTFAPFGPFITTVDEIADPQRLKVRLDVDGVCLQESSTERMVFSVAELIARHSADTMLEVGTVIATGTPAGVAPVRQPHTWLKPGAVVRMSVEGLGLLANPVVEATR